MKILLIDPPFKRFTGFVNFYFPIGLAYLAAALRDTDHETAIFDVDALDKGSDIDFSDEYRRLELYRQGLNNDESKVWQDIKMVLKDHNPDIVGITAMTTKFGSVLKTAEIVKRYNPGLIVIVGGPHATLLPEQVLKSDNIDIVVRGEGEITFVELVEILARHLKAKVADNDRMDCKKFYNENGFNHIKGISFKSNREIVHNPDRELIKDMDKIPSPARHLLMHPQNYTSEDMGAIMTSRGCPFKCTYCCHPWGRQVRQRSVESVIQEMKGIKKTYKTGQFEFKDDSFTVKRKWVIELCDKLISEKLKVNWGCTTRVDILDDEMIKKMKKAGCNVIKLGIETGSDRILKETKKGVTFKQIMNTASLLNKHGIFWSGYFMIGLPMETKEDILKTCNILKELNPYYAGLGVYNPFPKTELFEQGVQIDLLFSDVELDHFFKTNPKDYYFIDPAKRMTLMAKEEFDELAPLMMDKFHQHNIKPGNIVRRAWARRRSYFADYRMLWGDIRKVIKWVRR